MAEGDVRADLLAAGEAAFASRGYAATTVDDVIRLSGTSRATFYRYFNGKEQLFEELSRACFREMRAAVRAVAATAHGPVGRPEVIGLLERYEGINDRFGGVIRAWTELTGPADSPMHERGTAAVGAMFEETAALLDRSAAAAGTPPLAAGELTTRAALLFLLVERSVFYVSSRVSRLDPERLGPTLATLVERAYLGTSS
jgi:AcrR family transcriptional regulator